jgi:hypothetical protein
MAKYSDAERQAMNEVATAEDQRCLAGVLFAAARNRGGTIVVNAAEALRLSSPRPGFPASAMEMRMRGLPELAKKPGFGGITVSMVGPDLWEIRAAAPPPAPVIRSLPPVPLALVAAPPAVLPKPQPGSANIAAQAPRRAEGPAVSSPRPVAPPRPPASAPPRVELLKAVPTEARRLAANAASWAAIDQAISEAVEAGGIKPSAPQRQEILRSVYVAWLNADPRDAGEKALSAARKGVSACQSNPPPRAA